MNEDRRNSSAGEKAAAQQHGLSYSWIVEPVRAVVSLVGVLFLLALSVSMIVYKLVAAGLLFLALAVFAAHSLAAYGATVRVDDKGVSKSFLGLFRRSLRWEEIGEVGMAGSRVFTHGRPTKVGTLYLYVSPKQLDDDRRFAMMLKWPDLSSILMRYTVKRVAALQNWWVEELVQYNTGRLMG